MYPSRAPRHSLTPSTPPATPPPHPMNTPNPPHHPSHPLDYAPESATASITNTTSPFHNFTIAIIPEALAPQLIRVYATKFLPPLPPLITSTPHPQYPSAQAEQAAPPTAHKDKRDATHAAHDPPTLSHSPPPPLQLPKPPHLPHPRFQTPTTTPSPPATTFSVLILPPPQPTFTNF